MKVICTLMMMFVISLSFATTVTVNDSIKTNQSTKTIFLSNKEAQNDVLLHEEFKELREEIKQTNKILKDDSTSIIANWLSVIGIAITIFLGWLTYRLTVKYGESTQRVEDLEKIITSLEEQRIRAIESSKPLLKDTKIGINRTNVVNQFLFFIIIKNYGFSTAYNIKLRWTVCQLNEEGEIISSGNHTTSSESEYQNFLHPNEEWKYEVIGGLNGLKQLEHLIHRVELAYFDRNKNENESFLFYYKITPKVTGDGVVISTLTPELKEKIDLYLLNQVSG